MCASYSCAATYEKSIPATPEIPPPKRCAHENRGEKKELKKWKNRKMTNVNTVKTAQKRKIMIGCRQLISRIGISVIFAISA